MNLTHGGNLSAATHRFGIPRDQWLDLSTGISPWSWPVPKVPEVVWRSLPDEDDGLIEQAANYFDCALNAVVPVPGSQFALQHLPGVLGAGRVAVPRRGYEEHAQAWLRHGHSLRYYDSLAEVKQWVATAEVEHVLVINPNNPSGDWVPAAHLMAIHKKLSVRGGYLLVDEAFIDCRPEASLSPLCPQAGLIVLRSIGKFFGLAGIRLGFMLAPAAVAEALAAHSSPWHVAHPARWIGRRALADTLWQAMQRNRLCEAHSNWLAFLIQALPQLQFKSTALFASGYGDEAFCQALYNALGNMGLLVRLHSTIAGKGLVRFGLPHHAQQQKAQSMINQAVEEITCVSV